ncbi:hypothetical protein ACFQMF_01665 [Halorubrum rutilum]|uniref:Uncharacterized protein n=1 Tax=Halorubrum rutilum TaxID=1364933 RepID=A0ABD6AID7_9EURY|nr:hypothetical protein [Halorubrum rutilum]
MTDGTNRRSFLAVTGTSTAAALAGCSGGSPSQTDDGNETTANDDESEAEAPDPTEATQATLTIQVQPDQEALTTAQEDLQEQIEEGELTRQEAQEELQSTQAELTAEAVRAYEETAADADGVSVEDAGPEYGLLRVNAPAATFVRGLQDGDVSAVLPSEYYVQYIRQQRIQEQIATQQEDNGNTTDE